MPNIFSKLTAIILSTDPTAPPAGHVTVYAKSGGIYSRTTDGTVALLGNTTAPSKTYAASLTQAGTAAPTATVHENGLSADIVWTRDSEGVYFGTLASAFTSAKTHIIATLNGGSGTPLGIRAAWTSANVITVTTVDNTGAGTDDVDFSVQITVYP